MTGWLVLALLIPMILVPVVLLFGFAGCQLVFPLDEKPPVFEDVFDKTLTVPQFKRIRTIVQRIEEVSLRDKSGNQVRIFLQPPESGSFTIDKIYISQAASAGKEWDSAEDLTAVFISDIDNGVPQITIPAGSVPFELDPPVEYKFDGTKALLLAFDIADSGNMRSASLPLGQNSEFPDGAAFIGPLQMVQNPPLPPIWEASEAVRRPDYEKQPFVYMVTRIEVAP